MKRLAAILALVLILIVLISIAVETGGLFILDGEDAGSTPWEWTSINNSGSATFALDGAAKNNGSYGYTFTPDSTNTAYGRKTFTAIDEIYVRFYIFIPTGFNVGTGAGEYVDVAMFNAVLSDEIRFGIYTTSGGVPNSWRFWVNYTPQYSTTNFSLNSWHRIEIRYYKYASTGGGELWIDGTSVLSDYDQTISAQASSFYLGCELATSAPGAGDVLYFDDIKADTSPVGAYSSPAGWTNMPAALHAIIWRPAIL